MNAAEFRTAFDVSRETMARLEIHLALLTRWNPKINLVSRASLEHVWDRHFADSAQLWRLRPPSARLWLDLGSGAGFPGLVIAAFAADQAPELDVHLVESDQRKAAFLETVVRTAELRATVLAERVETLAAASADVVSARALAPLGTLLEMGKFIVGRGVLACFPRVRRCIRRSPRPPRIGGLTIRFTPA